MTASIFFMVSDLVRRPWDSNPGSTRRLSTERRSGFRRAHRHAAWTAHRGDNIFGVCRDAMLVEIQTVILAFGRDAQQTHRVDGVHYDQGDR